MLSLHQSEEKALDFYLKIKDKIVGLEALELTEEHVKKLIISKPTELLELNNQFMNAFFEEYNFEEYSAYANSPKEAKETNKYDDKTSKIKNAFNYSKIIGNKYDLAELLDQHTCTYCNRNYVKTVGKTSSRVTRAEYDHFFSKSKYPFLALSFYNLIPICSPCNKKKSNKDFNIATHLHPYFMDNEEKKFNFSFRKKDFNDNNVKINISTLNEDINNKINKTFDDLALRKIYNAHSDKELKDLLDLRYKYSDNYIEILINKTFNGIMSKEEIYRTIFGVEIKEEDYHKRPFSKFKHDIIEELLRIK